MTQLGSLMRKWISKKIKAKSLLYEVKLSDPDASKLHKILRAGLFESELYRRLFLVSCFLF